jgi:ATP-dependent Lon protease
MTTHFYPDGPSVDDLLMLKQELKFRGRHGLFLNAFEFTTFADLLAEMKEPPTAACATVPEDADQEKLAVPEQESDGKVDDAAEEAKAAETETQDGATGEEANPGEIVSVQAGVTVALFSIPILSEIQRNLDNIYRDQQSREQLASRFDKMRVRGELRCRSELPGNWSERLDRLVRRYPNFVAVVHQVRVECQLAAFSRPRVVRLPPILLAGAPGIGKTAFAHDLAQVLDTGFFSYSLETAQHGAALCGSSRYWSNTRTGLVFDALVDHDGINPVFLIDELDKVSTDTRHDPAAPFYQLLERQQAATFCDESIPELPIDASHITWIFTANEIDRVPAPLCNRLMVFHVPPPTADQGRVIVETLFNETVFEIARSIHEADGLELLKHLEMSAETVSLLAQQSVRQAKIKIRSAIATALANRSRVLHIRDAGDLAVLSAVAAPAWLH